MPECGLIVVKWMGSGPAVGMCTCCAENFEVPQDSRKTRYEAEESLGEQFDQHVCKPHP